VNYQGQFKIISIDKAGTCFVSNQDSIMKETVYNQQQIDYRQLGINVPFFIFFNLRLIRAFDFGYYLGCTCNYPVILTPKSSKYL
jgi:hypothetical protein